MRKTVCLLMILSLLISCICGASAESRSYTLTDAAGRTVTLEDAPKRVVSGYYISSSLMIALHAEELICGIEAKADTRPIYALAAPELLTLPDVGSVKSFSLEACLAADPDLVILPLRLKSVAAELEGMHIPVLLVDPEDISSLEEMIRLLGAALDREAEADALLSYNRQLSEELTAKLQNARRPDVYLAGNSDYLRTAGSGKLMIDTGKHPGELKDMVCSPAGTTIEAVKVLEEGGFRANVMDAVIAAAERNRSL